MRKVIFASLFSAIAIVGSVSVFGGAEKPSPEACSYGQCAAIKSNGYQCGNCAQKYSAYCWTHNNN